MPNGMRHVQPLAQLGHQFSLSMRGTASSRHPQLLPGQRPGPPTYATRTQRDALAAAARAWRPRSSIAYTAPVTGRVLTFPSARST
jgi:hypothetical protein